MRTHFRTDVTETSGAFNIWKAFELHHVKIRDQPIYRGPSHVTQTNRVPAEDMVKAMWNPSPDHESSTSQARWRKDWVKVSSELAQDRRAWSASVQNVVNAVGDAGSIRPG